MQVYKIYNSTWKYIVALFYIYKSKVKVEEW